MAATTIAQTEAPPENYPASPDGLSAAAQALDPAMVWQRIEAYTSQRWSERAVEWMVEGPGEWRPPLSPATISGVEVWSGADEWEAHTLRAVPLGGCYLPATGPYRFTVTVGGGDPHVPEAVTEAFRRLAEYMASRPSKAGARTESVSAGSITVSHARSASWMGQAMQNSGAGDLLRSFRRV